MHPKKITLEWSELLSLNLWNHILVFVRAFTGELPCNAMLKSA